MKQVVNAMVLGINLVRLSNEILLKKKGNITKYPFLPGLKYAPRNK